MQSSDIAIIILSCDKFRITWKPCIDHFFSAWDCPYNVYLLNNRVASNDNRVKDLLTGEDTSWSDSLIKGLSGLNEERVFFIYDDTFLTKVDTKRINEIFNLARQHDMDAITLRKNIFGKGHRFTKSVFRINSVSKYRNSLFLTLIKRNVLLQLLRSGENAWQFEKAGNARSADLNFYSVRKSNSVKYLHGIVKGKWMPFTKRYLEKNGYELNDDKIGTHSLARFLSIRTYTFLFFCASWFIARVKFK